MANLETNYLGIKLKNPLVVGASSLSKNIDTIKQLEAAGAGGVVIKSLFEEQVQLERASFEQELTQYDALYAEAVEIFPKIEHGGPKEHLYWLGEAKKAVGLPLFASLNAVTPEIWVDYARQLAETGVDGLELNFYSPPLGFDRPGADIEKLELETFSKVREAVKIPIAVKLHPYYTNVYHLAQAFASRGADAVVLFNRLFQPDIDIRTMEERSQLRLSGSGDSLATLRWVALLYGNLDAQLVASTGINSGKDMVKMILAGASSVQVVSALYKNKLTHIGAMLEELSGWMDENKFGTLEEFRGKVSKKQVKDPWSFERAHYIKALLGFD